MLIWLTFLIESGNVQLFNCLKRPPWNLATFRRAPGDFSVFLTTDVSAPLAPQQFSCFQRRSQTRQLQWGAKETLTTPRQTVLLVRKSTVLLPKHNWTSFRHNFKNVHKKSCWVDCDSIKTQTKTYEVFIASYYLSYMLFLVYSIQLRLSANVIYIIVNY